MIAAEVEIAKHRSGWSTRQTLQALGIPPATYYRQQRQAGQVPPPRPVALAAALPEEREAVLTFARQHPELRHRALAWTMVDRGVAALAPSTVYRILAAAGAIARWTPPLRVARRRLARPNRPGEVWQTDLRYVKVAGRTYYLLVFLDVYSRYVVSHELLRDMTAGSVTLGAQRALETVAPAARAAIHIQSDNGSPFVSGEFGRVLAAHGVGHQRIYPHTPEQNAFVERVMRTLGEPLHEEELSSFHEAQQAIAEIVQWYNEERLHSALGFVPPAAVHHGQAAEIHERRRDALAAARLHRRAVNLGRRQLALALPSSSSSQSQPLTC